MGWPRKKITKPADKQIAVSPSHTTLGTPSLNCDVLGTSTAHDEQLEDSRDNEHDLVTVRSASTNDMHDDEPLPVCTHSDGHRNEPTSDVHVHVLSRILSTIQMPCSSWSMYYHEASMVGKMYKIEDVNGVPKVTRCLAITSSGSWDIYVHDLKVVNATILVDVPSVPYSHGYIPPSPLKKVLLLCG